MVDGYNRSQRDKKNDFLFLAWHVAAFSRQTELPQLSDVLIDPEQKPKAVKKQTEEDMIAMCRLLNAAFGGNEVVV